MARIAETLVSPVVERLDLTRHFITFDCDFNCYMVVNPSSADGLEGSDVVRVPIGAWQIDAWRMLLKEDFPNRAGFSAVFVYDSAKIGVDGNARPEVRYSDVDIAHAVSGLRGQPVNITQFSCHSSMPVEVTNGTSSPVPVKFAGSGAIKVLGSNSNTMPNYVCSSYVRMHDVFMHPENYPSLCAPAGGFGKGRGATLDFTLLEDGGREIFKTYEGSFGVNFYIPNDCFEFYQVDLSRISFHFVCERFRSTSDAYSEILTVNSSGVGSYIVSRKGETVVSPPFACSRLLFGHTGSLEATCKTVLIQGVYNNFPYKASSSPVFFNKCYVQMKGDSNMSITVGGVAHL